MNRPIASIGTRRRLKWPASAGVAAVITVTAFAQFSTPEVRADKFDDQIRAIQQEIDQYQAKAQGLKKQSNSLEKELAQLSTDTKVIQGQIDLSQAKYDKLQVQIVDTQKKIDTNRDALGLVVSDIYIEGNISPLEILASSKNIGEYLDKSSYRASISENLTNMIAQIRESKEELDNQQKEVTRVLSDQKLAKSQLAKKVDELILLIGKIEKKNLPSLFDQIDFVFLLSILESFSNNIIESWTYKRPLIISDEHWARTICEGAALYVNNNNNNHCLESCKVC